MKQLVFCLMILFIAPSFSANAQDKIATHRKAEVRIVPDSVVEKMKKDKDFTYANDMSYWKEEPPRQRNAFDRIFSALSQSKALKVLMYTIFVATIVFAMYQVMIVNNFFIFSRSRKKRNAAGTTGEDAITGNLDEKINDAVAIRNYRQAIRFMYLKTLKLLHDDHLITLHAKSTNQDYIRQLYNHHNLGQFRQLTRIYEYVWYGEFDPSASQFEIIKTNFNRFNQHS